MLTGQQVLAPGVGNALHLAAADEEADDLDRLVFEHTLAAQGQARHVLLALPLPGARQHLVIPVGGVDHGAATGTADGQDVAGTGLHRRTATRAAKDLGLHGDGRRRAVTQVGHFQGVEADCLANKQQRGRFGIIQRGEPGLVAQIGRSDRIATPDLERQLALAGDALGVFKIAERPHLAGHLQALTDAQRRKVRQRLIHLAHEGEHILTTGLRQPAGAHVVEEQVPLVPDALAVLDLDAPDQREMHALVAAFGTQLQRRAILDQGRHLADVFQILVVTDQRALAIFADSKDRRRRFEDNRRPAGRAGGSEGHAPGIRSVS